MKDKKDMSTIDWVEDSSSSLKNKDGAICVPIDPVKFLKMIKHRIDEAAMKTEAPKDVIQELHDCMCYWLQDNDMRQLDNYEDLHKQYVKRLN